MQSKDSGLSFIEILIITIFLIIIGSFTLPKFIEINSLTPSKVLSKEALSCIHSAYSMCQIENKENPNNCTTVNKLIEYIEYNEINPESGSLVINNDIKIDYNPKDSLKDGTSFAVELPDSAGNFTIYLTKDGKLSNNPPGNDQAIGGKTITESYNPF